jgi:ATP-dependent helicase/nuclease subunit A
VLVAAGAGSGKTSLLVAYYVHALLDEGVPIESLVAVTFTRKAAGELADRIRRDLQGRGRHDLARALDTGTIGTIHSLCRRILRQNALQAGVDPAFAVLEADAAMLLKREAAAEVWEEAILEADEPALAVLAEHEKTLRAELVPLYDRLRAIGREAPGLGLDPPCSSIALWDRLERVLQSAIEAGQSVTRRTLTIDNTLGRLSECLEWALSVDRGHPRSDDLARSSTFFPARGTPLECHLQPVREALTACRHSLAHTQLVPLVEAMNRLLARFHQRYEGLKRQRGVLDFADLELRTHALLFGARSEGHPVFGERSRVMIDEFQDTNELQCSILESLGSAGVLMVGDERQSIYRFRGADVKVFTRRLEGVVSSGSSHDGRDDACRLHRLDINYRSRAEVLAFINHLFAQEDFFGLGFVALQCGAAGIDDIPVGLGGNEVKPGAEGVTEHSVVEVLAVERGGGEGPSGPKPLIQQAEAQASAWAVERLLRDEGWEPKDLVILSPALTHADLYREALRARNIPSYVVRGRGYYSREEIADIRCLLQVLVNPHDDLALVTVLRSPLAGLSDDALYLLGRTARREGAGSLWQTLRQGHPAGLPPEDRRLLDELVTRLTSLRRRVGRPGMGSLIDDAITDLGYDVRVLASDEGLRRFANIRKLMRLADEFEALHGPDVAAFVRVLAEMEDVSDQEGSAATLAEGENVVRVMTVHQAKGLEFPVVLLTGLGSDTLGGGHSSFVVDNEGRAGVFLKGSRRETYEEHDLCLGPAVDIVEDGREKDRLEDVRLLYVAMTRAKERLVLVGASPEKGGLDRCRLSRIVGSLGLGAFPLPGENVVLPEVHARVRGLSYEAVAASPAGPALAAAVDARPPAPTCTSAPALFEDEATRRFLSVAAPPLRVPSRLSFSGLSVYLDCPRRFYLERVLGLRQDLGAGGEEAEEAVGAGERVEDLLDGAEAGGGREVGLLVHALLERSVLHGPVPTLESLRALATELTGGVPAGNAACPAADSSPGTRLSPAQSERALALARAFWSSPVAQRSGLEGALKEAPFCFLDQDILISGIMDLVWEEEGRVFIVDYKTNSLSGRSPGEAAASYGLQASLYALAALRAGAREVQMEFIFLERAEQSAGLSYGRDDAARLGESLEVMLRPLRAGEYPVREGAACSRCVSARVCGRLR